MFLPSLAAFHDYELNFSVQQDINISVYSLLQTKKGNFLKLYLCIFVCIQINMAVLKRSSVPLSSKIWDFADFC